MTSSNLLTIFNDHFVEFITDIHNVFPEDVDILTAKNSLIAIRKANPKLIVKIWISYVATPYQNEILSGNIDFFINKNYANDLSKSSNSDQIMSCIDRLRDPVKQMNPGDQQKTMKYIQNLSKIAFMVPQ